MRRHFVDSFFFTNSELLKDKKVLDIGGKKAKKRGLFDVGAYSADVAYVNIDKTTEPDIVSDAASIPLPNDSFDAVIMGELLEHVPHPEAVLQEAYRLLAPGGRALATVPFMVGVHGDPYDYRRFTHTALQRMAEEAGFREAEIERQGAIFAVLALMIQHIFLSKGVSWRPIQIPLIKLLMWLDSKTTAPLLTAWTTGYGIILTK